MGFIKRLLGNRGNSVSAGRDIKSSYIHQDNSIHIGDSGPTCPFNWRIGYSTCGCCPKANGCEKWHNLKRHALDNMSD